MKERDTDILDLWELMAWREEEFWITKLLVQTLQVLHKNKESPKFYLIPMKGGVDLLVKLLTEPDTEKVYLSFPITGLPDKRKKEVDDFKNCIKEKYIAFDPFNLTERRILNTFYSVFDEITEVFQPIKAEVDKIKAKNNLENLNWEPFFDDYSHHGLTRFNFENSRMLGREIWSILKAIDSQIISRDYQLIDQSDFVLMFIRTDEGNRPIISAGCQTELVYAYSKGKDVHVVCSAGRRTLGPWVTEFSEVYNDISSALNKLLPKEEDKKC